MHLTDITQRKLLLDSLHLATGLYGSGTWDQYGYSSYSDSTFKRQRLNLWI